MLAYKFWHEGDSRLIHLGGINDSAPTCHICGREFDSHLCQSKLGEIGPLTLLRRENENLIM